MQTEILQKKKEITSLQSNQAKHSPGDLLYYKSSLTGASEVFYLIIGGNKQFEHYFPENTAWNILVLHSDFDQRSQGTIHLMFESELCLNPDYRLIQSATV